jgi:hypothetical protein
MLAAKSMAQEPLYFMKVSGVDDSGPAIPNHPFRVQHMIKAPNGDLLSIVKTEQDVEVFGTLVNVPATPLGGRFTVFRFTPEGQLLWAVPFGLAVGGQDNIGLSCDAAGRVYVSPRAGGSVQLPDTLIQSVDSPVIRLLADGTFDKVMFNLSLESFSGLELHYDRFYTRKPIFDRMYVVDTMGTILQNLQLASQYGGSDYAVLPDTSLLFAGKQDSPFTYNGTPMQGDVPAFAHFGVARFDRNGQVMWYKGVGGDFAENFAFHWLGDLVVADGNRLVMSVGYTQPFVVNNETVESFGNGSPKMALVEMDLDGNEVRHTVVSSPSAQVLGKHSGLATHNGEVFFFGFFLGQLQLLNQTFGQGGPAMIHGKVDAQLQLVYADAMDFPFGENPYFGNPFVHHVGDDRYMLGCVANSFLPASHPCIDISSASNKALFMVVRDAVKPLPVVDFEVVTMPQTRLTAFNASTTGADSWSWNFGDGNTSTGVSPLHTYANGGNFNACLTATNVCGSVTECQVVSYFGGFSVLPTRGVSGEAVPANVRGGGINAGSQVRLLRSGEAPVLLSNTSLAEVWVGLLGIFDLAGVAPGLWDVEITVPGNDPVLITNGFEVLADGTTGLKLRNLTFQDPTPSLVPIAVPTNGLVEYRSGRTPHDVGFRLQNTGPVMAVGVPVISVLPDRLSSTYYEPRYNRELPQVPQYDPIEQFRAANGYIINTQANNDFFQIRANKVRVHIIPVVSTQFTHRSTVGISLNQAAKGFAHHSFRDPVFSSRAFAGEYAPVASMGLADHLRRAVRRITGQLVEVGDCPPCLAQAESAVMEIYAQDIAANYNPNGFNVSLQNTVFAGTGSMPVYDLRQVLADILAEVLRSGCITGFTASNVSPTEFTDIVKDAFEQFVVHPNLNFCKEPNTTATGPASLQKYQPRRTRNVLVSNTSGSGASPMVAGPALLPVVSVEGGSGAPPEFISTFFRGTLTGDGWTEGLLTGRSNGETVNGNAAGQVIEGTPGEEAVVEIPATVLERNGLAVRTGPATATLTYYFPGSSVDDELGAFDHYMDCESFWPCVEANLFNEYSTAAEAQAAWNSCVIPCAIADLAENETLFAGPQLPFGEAPDLTPQPPSNFFGQGCTENAPVGRKRTLPGDVTSPLSDDLDGLAHDNFGWRCSRDPNDKYGPGDNEEDTWIKPDRSFPYIITYENEPAASLAAQTVRVVDPIDTNVFDLASLRFGPIAVSGRHFIEPEPDNHNGVYVVDIRPEINAYLKLETRVDDATGIVTWTFSTLDPLTLSPTTDDLLGFLPPNDSTGMGTGVIHFTIDLRADAPDGSTVCNQAEIFFDGQDPIITSNWCNNVDGTVPQSAVDALPPSTPSTEFTITWSGTDAVGEIAYYELFVSIDGDDFQLMDIAGADVSSRSVTGTAGTNFRFYSVATDKAGNREELPAEGFDAETTITATTVEEQANGGFHALCFPNPAQEELNILVGDAAQLTHCRILDMEGRVVKRTTLQSSNRMNIAQLAPGSYIVELMRMDELVRLRFIKQ